MLEPLHPLQIEAYRRMTPTEKHRAFLGLAAFARRLKRSALRADHPEWTEDQINGALAKIFLHGYV